ncbi:MAG: hypothetical protein GY940_04265, partial [bacterium]|nr:hypothetical protein [bacterium]
MFVNTLPIRNYPSGIKKYKTFLQEIKETTLKLYMNQDYQFEDLVEKISTVRDTSRNPVFDVAFNMLNQGGNDRHPSPGVTEESREEGPVSEEGPVPGTSQFDLSAYLWESGGKIFFNLVYCTALFKSHTIDRFIDYFKQIVTAVIDSPDCKLADIKITMEQPQDFPGITPVSQLKIPASYHQERLWFIDRFESGFLYGSSPLYHNIPLVLDIAGGSIPEFRFNDS